MARIKLTQGKFAIVDKEDFEWLNQWKWNYEHGYARRISFSNKNSKGTKIYMHRLINNTPEGMQTDHINRNKLDNKRKNLRTVTSSQNHINRPAQRNNSNGYKGVYRDKRRNLWFSSITRDYKSHYLGGFKNIEEAILARKKGEILYHAI